MRLVVSRDIRRGLQVTNSIDMCDDEYTVYLGEYDTTSLYNIGWIFDLQANDQIPCGWTG